MTYKNLLWALSNFFFQRSLKNTVEDEKEEENSMKSVINIIEHHTGLDLFNQFKDLYE